ncbi:MAG: cupin [Acidobacteria bacterium]|nr:cupin [Acidobacteriota bacterium]|tara:strand:+ start:414 stop:800 length:387 start_codon:yes stop_codon:yes gene_type:complete
MKVFTLEALASEAADQQTFVGKASLTRMNKAATQPNTNVYRVEFEASARTNWHSHTGPQLLQVLSGVCRFQTHGGPVRQAVAGDLVTIEPGERHWHGASSSGPMTHVAININSTTSWFEPVSDDQFAG